jgi:hypothetical protein
LLGKGRGEWKKGRRKENKKGGREEKKGEGGKEGKEGKEGEEYLWRVVGGEGGRRSEERGEEYLWRVVGGEGEGGEEYLWRVVGGEGGRSALQSLQGKGQTLFDFYGGHPGARKKKNTIVEFHI